MRYFVVSYAHGAGFGRMMFGTSGPVDEGTVFAWEAECAKGTVGKVVTIAISEIDGPITPEGASQKGADNV